MDFPLAGVLSFLLLYLPVHLWVTQNDLSDLKHWIASMQEIFEAEGRRPQKTLVWFMSGIYLEQPTREVKP